MNQVAKINKSPLAQFAKTYNVDPQEMEHVLKTTVFHQKGDKVITNEQMMALMLVAKEYNLNPFTKEIYAFPSQNGIVPIVGVDGWLNIINSNKHFDGMEFEEAENKITIGKSKPCPEWIECIIYRKDRARPTRIKEFLDEAFKDSKYPGPWETHTKRMLRHKAMIQCARHAFSLSGIYEEDEAQAIIDNELKEINEPPTQTKPDPSAAPVSQKRTAQVVESVSEPQEEIEETDNLAILDENDQSTVKKLTVRTKNALIKKIKACETSKDLDNLVPELAEYAEDSPMMIPIRAAWKDKKQWFNRG